MADSSNDPIPGLLTRLTGARTHGEAALACLDALVRVAARAGADVPDGRILRAMVHLRPKSGYAGLSVLEAGRDALRPPSGGQGLLPSASVARRVMDTRRPAAVDVTLRVLYEDGDYVRTGWTDGPDPDALPEGSQVRLMKRDATHIYVMPLPGPGGVIGLASIEAVCRSAVGTPYIWARCTAVLEQILAVAGPYLASLPPAPMAAIDDPLLPVVGVTMAPLVEVLAAFSAEDETLLIRGETGTGKSRIARWCHSRSLRAEGPFEVVDLLSVPTETQMGELFGWKRGAFTGAIKDHDGFVARADGGTLFIDEIDKLSLEAQAALLTLLEERQYRVLGDSGGRQRANVRFIIGTNADLQAEVEAGTFREDLFYRIDVLPIGLPALRERADEIPDWARFMLERRRAERADPPVHLDEDGAALLARGKWPGNLRQLDNVVRRAYTLAGIKGGSPRVVSAEHIAMAERLSSGRQTAASGGLRDGFASLLGRLATDGVPDGFADIDLPGALHGILLAEAVVLTGSWDAAFELLGRASLVANRNHHKVLKRDWARACALFSALGVEPPAVLAAALDR